MRPCEICAVGLPDGYGLGVCPHGVHHTECCVRRTEDHLKARRPIDRTDEFKRP